MSDSNDPLEMPLSPERFDDPPLYGDPGNLAAHHDLPVHNEAAHHGASIPGRLADEFVTWVKTLASAAVYATLIVTFGVQVARVDGQSMAPTLENHDRLLVNKFAYLSYVGEP